MGEGWSDFMATAIRLKVRAAHSLLTLTPANPPAQPGDTRATNYPIGAWVNNSLAGIRAYPYSTSLATNPLTYTSVKSMNTVHEIGTVWCTMLYEVLWNLIDKHGKNDAAFPTRDENGVPSDGKFLAMQLVVDGMKL
jgi:extracellular elastinolytic metalloproteinase